MKTPVKVVGSTLVLLAAALGLQAQATNQRSISTTPGTSSSISKSTSNTSSPAASPATPVGDTLTNGSQEPDPSRSANANSNAAIGAGANSNTFTAGQSDTPVTTVVQQIDAQGPAVLERVTTEFADISCTPENAKLLFNALHEGTEVALSGDGKTATFKPAGDKLGYGNAYLALALAAEALRNAGVSGCATPEQWKSVLIGGSLAATGTPAMAHTSASAQFPGILTLHSQGQGWDQIAQATNIQLGQIVSSAQSSFKLNRDSTLTPTGRTSAEMQRDLMNAGKDDPSKDGHAKSHDDANQDDQDAHADPHKDFNVDKGLDQGTPPDKGGDNR